jgi:type IV secretory pathway VirD2 relaxase
MPKRLIEIRGTPILDLTSYARPGPGRRDRMSVVEIDQITRTARRVPEVMVKVLTHGRQDLKGVQRHLDYLGRKGDLPIETDEGERIQGRGVEKELLNDWDLEIEEYRRRSALGPRKDRSPPKLVHKVLFSMPAGTPPEKVLKAVRNFARAEFALKHRYAMVLHTDEPHPHVHMVIKAVSDQGVRLNIRKATLRDWRQKFAAQLRREGVAANATERAVRGGSRTQKTDGIYRANLRGESRHMRDRAYAVRSALEKGEFTVEEGKWTLRATRREVEQGWRAVSEILVAQRHPELAAEVRRFVTEMPPPLTEREQIAAAILQRTRQPPYPDRALSR